MTPSDEPDDAGFEVASIVVWELLLDLSAGFADAAGSSDTDAVEGESDTSGAEVDGGEPGEVSVSEGDTETVAEDVLAAIAVAESVFFG